MSGLISTHITPWELFQKALPDTSLSDFEFGFPLLLAKNEQAYKSRDDVAGRRYIQGVASTPDRDLQDEYVIQKGLDLRYFLNHGYYNDDHKPGPENKVGQPTIAVIKKIKDSNDRGVLGLWTKGYLWVKGFHPGADHIWNLAKALEASDADRQMGFSIQGKVLTREGSRIIKAWVQDIAITPSPVNVGTWMELVHDLSKGLSATAKDVEDMKKGLSAVSWDNVSLVGETREEQPALGIVTEGINFCYDQYRASGLSAIESRSRALAAVAHGLLG